MQIRVLVVDDIQDNLSLFQAILERKNYEVETALNGEEALRMLHKEPFDLILSDILMPVMDGFQLLQECKSDTRFQKIPFIFVTGAFLDKKDEELALQIGVESFVRKPVEPEVLLNVVESVLSAPKSTQKGKKPKKERAAIDKQVSVNLMEKLRARMQELEEEIADRKKAESALKQAESEFRLLFDTMVQGVLFMDAAGRVTLANPAALQILGLAADKLVGTTPNDIRLTAMHEDGSYFTQDELPMIRALRTGKLVEDITMTVYNSTDKKYHWIRGRAVPQFRPG
jgi:CheY-like chemotaxis protein